MSWPFSFILSLRSTPLETNLDQKIFCAVAGSSPRKPGSLQVDLFFGYCFRFNLHQHFRRNQL